MLSFSRRSWYYLLWFNEWTNTANGLKPPFPLSVVWFKCRYFLVTKIIYHAKVCAFHAHTSKSITSNLVHGEWPISLHNFQRKLKSHTVIVLIEFMSERDAGIYFLTTVGYSVKYTTYILLHIQLLDSIKVHVFKFFSKWFWVLGWKWHLRRNVGLCDLDLAI